MNDISTYKAKLEEEKGRLEAELETVGRRNPSNPKDWEAVADETGEEPDQGDRANNLDNYTENNAILTDLENRYNEVCAALERIAAGTYGTCEEGGEEIGADRLDADPAARTCTAHMAA